MWATHPPDARRLPLATTRDEHGDAVEPRSVGIGDRDRGDLGVRVRLDDPPAADEPSWHHEIDGRRVPLVDAAARKHAVDLTHRGVATPDRTGHGSPRADVVGGRDVLRRG
jgi:hypothetical protein